MSRCQCQPSCTVREIIERYGGQSEMLIPMMQDIQTAEGYLPKQQLQLLARELDVPLSRVLRRGHLLQFLPPTTQGEHTITLCMGTVCYLKGADQIAAVIQEEFQVAPGGTSPDGKFSFSPVNCLAACALAPVMVVDGEYFGGLSAGSALDILAENRRRKEARQSRRQARQRGKKAQES